MYLILLVRYWQYVVIVVLTLMLAIASWCLQDATKEMQLMRVTHDLEVANNTAETSLKLAEIARLNNERYHNAISENTKATRLVADSYASNNIVVNSLSDTIDKNTAAFIAANADADAQYTLALADISKQCVFDIKELARQADGHVNDIRMMQQAWPKQ